MTGTPLLAAAGFAELSRAESQQFCQTLSLAYAIPFALFTLAYIAFLLFFFRKPVRRQQTNTRAVLALIAIWATIGGILLVPSLLFLPEAPGLL